MGLHNLAGTQPQVLPHLVHLGEWGPHGSCWQAAPAAVFEEPPRGPFPPRAQHAAGGLLPLQGAARRLVPAQLCAPLAVAVWCAWLSGVARAFGWCRAGGYTLGDVLVVRRWASLVGAAGNKRRWGAEGLLQATPQCPGLGEEEETEIRAGIQPQGCIFVVRPRVQAGVVLHTKCLLQARPRAELWMGTHHVIS